jgi:hypothetical protein
LFAGVQESDEMMGLLILLAMPIIAGLLVMPILRFPAARYLLQVRGRHLTILTLCPLLYLTFSTLVGLYIGHLNQRTAFMESDSIFWEGDNPRIYFGITAKHWVLFAIAVLPATLFDILLVRTAGRNLRISDTVEVPGTPRRILGWVVMIVANGFCPLIMVIVGVLIAEVVYGGY